MRSKEPQGNDRNRPDEGHSTFVGPVSCRITSLPGSALPALPELRRLQADLPHDPLEWAAPEELLP